jgi:hypothetical protein
MKEADMLETKIDLLLKKFDEHATNPTLAPSMPWTHRSCVTSVGMLAIQAMIARRPAKMLPTSTMGFTNKEEATIMAGLTNPDHHSKVI